MPKSSAGFLPFRRRQERWEVFLVHPGGPFWRKKDMGSWSVAKGEMVENEMPLAAAHREFTEETGFAVSVAPLALGEFEPYRGKRLHVWAVEQDFDPVQLVSNSFQLEWPPHSGRRMEFPEVDRADWFTLEMAALKLTRGQREVLLRLEAMLASRS